MFIRIHWESLRPAKYGYILNGRLKGLSDVWIAVYFFRDSLEQTALQVGPFSYKFDHLNHLGSGMLKGRGMSPNQNQDRPKDECN